jgi:hypothetical protein
MTEEFLQRRALLRILEVKDSDIRILNLEQCRDAEQNNGYLTDAFVKMIYRQKKPGDWDRIVALSPAHLLQGLS